MTGQQRTWDPARALREHWREAKQTPGWIPFGYALKACGCLVDTFSNGAMREPCMAHESEGHLSALSEADGSHVARCLVLSCGWQETHMWAGEAISAAQRHWRETRHI